jgi:hypothetical protein
MFLLPIDVIGQDGENFDRVTQEGTCSAPHQLLKPRARASQPATFSTIQLTNITNMMTLFF